MVENSIQKYKSVYPLALLLYTTKMQRIASWTAWFFIILTAIGFFDATYLTAEHYRGNIVQCSILEGCETVTQSEYATVADAPVALFGTIYYLALLVLGLLFMDTGKPRWLRTAALLTPIGFAASLWFLYLQIFVIQALCLYCLISATTSTALFILGILVLRGSKTKTPQ
jgi:uncharacterized membrane protein